MLVVDVGAVTTRALLFDLVNGSYRFLAAGSAATTAGAPYRDVSEGVRLAIDSLQNLSGRTLVASERLIMPSDLNGDGIDAFAAVVSAGAPLKLAIVGLLEEVSLESAKRLAASVATGSIETLSLNDRRKLEARIDALVRLHPDLILLAGGTEGGASQSMLRMIEPVGLASYLLPEELRPAILYVGNSALQDEVRSSLEVAGARVHMAPNVRPALEVEQLEAAQARLAELSLNVRAEQLAGVSELHAWSGGNILPGPTAFGRVIRFLSKVHPSKTKGVLGIDVGASATTLAAAYAGELALQVFPFLGQGTDAVRRLDYAPLETITRWLMQPVDNDRVREYLQNKALFPASLPATVEDWDIEAALARSAMQTAVQLASPAFPGSTAAERELLPWFEPIVASGSVLTHAPSAAQTMLMLLDGLQPTGVSTVILDQNHLTAALGVAAAVNPLLTVQVLASAFLNLGTVIAPVGQARYGTPVLRIKVTYENDQENTLEIKMGALEVLRLPPGQKAKLHLQPLHRFDVGMGGPGRSGTLRVDGSQLGVVIDARGRPLGLPNDAGKRADLFKKWLWNLSG
jgi:hypothetical protein